MNDALSVRMVIASARNWFSEDRVPRLGVFVFIALALLPLSGISNYALHISVLVFLYAALGLGLNIVVGLAGLLDLGYAAFYAVGAYSYALLSVRYQLAFPVALLIGALLAALIGVVLGWPTIRARGDYLALVTLGFGEIIRLLMRNWDSLTNGPRGVMNVPPPGVAGITFSTPTHYYYLGLCLGSAALTLFWLIKRSAVGQQLAAVRDDEEAAIAIGINPLRWKLYAFGVGAFVAGIAGGFFASWQRFVSPESFTLNESILILSIVVLGGMGQVWPTVGAAAFLVFLPEALRGFQNQRLLVLGLFLVLAVVMQERLRLRRSAHQNKRSVEFHRSIVASQTSSMALLSATSADDQANMSLEAKIILEISGVSKRYGGVKALDQVQLSINRGEIIGLVGVNGAGKTTLLACIAGAIHPDAGKVELNNGRRQRIDGLPPYQVPRMGVVRTFQHPRRFPSLPAIENVRLGGFCREVPSVWEPFRMARPLEPLDGIAAEILSCTVDVPSSSSRVEQMSFVELKLMELARVFATRPSVVLIDEPAASMDEKARVQLVSILRKVNEQSGITMVVIEHDLGFLQSLCNRLIVMERGRVIADGAADDVLVKRAIQQTYCPGWGDVSA